MRGFSSSSSDRQVSVLRAKVIELEEALEAQPDQCIIDPIPGSNERKGDFTSFTVLKYKALGLPVPK